MGKYMKKSKAAKELQISQPTTTTTTMGVRTRAKTLALQRLNHHHAPPSAVVDSSSSCYLELRSRRLVKPSFNETKQQVNCRGSSKTTVSSVKSRGVSNGVNCEKDECFEGFGSFGDNCLEYESVERSTRESTPCSLIRDSNFIGAPGLATRKTSSTPTNDRIMSIIQSNIPATSEMEEFFALAEQDQQKLFTDKYNFDFVHELPLPGRYDWVQVVR